MALLRCILMQTDCSYVSDRYAILELIDRIVEHQQTGNTATATELDGLKASCHFKPPPDLQLQRVHNYNDLVQIAALQPSA